jgi:hypothetical protein
MKAMAPALSEMAAVRHPNGLLMDFADLRAAVGFEHYDRDEERYGAG